MFKVLNNTMSSYISHLECFFVSPHQYKKEIVYFDPGLALIFWFMLFCNNDNSTGLFTAVDL